MVVADLIEILLDANPEAPILLDHCGFISEADAVDIQGY